MGKHYLDTVVTGGSNPSSRTEEPKAYCKNCGKPVARYKEEADSYWHTMYERLRLDGCKSGPTILKYDTDPSKSDVEFK